ncbi:MAG TPA: hypothetical protein VEC02_00475 [Nitrososphaerales archaeon]|nr:hypothetical protein [Nitrososphaerales archaeon]
MPGMEYAMADSVETDHFTASLLRVTKKLSVVGDRSTRNRAQEPRRSTDDEERDLWP